MTKVNFLIDQPGVMYEDFLGLLDLPKEFQSEMNGYFTLSVGRSYRGKLIWGIDLVMSMQIIDGGGRSSKTVKMPLYIGGKAPTAPPTGFADRYILRIPYIIHSPGG